jgi:hypothetical protein
MRKILIFGLTLFLLSACIPPQGASVPMTSAPNVETMVAETFAALTAQAPLPATVGADSTTPTLIPTLTVTPTPEPGSISGSLSFPSEFIPPLRVVAFQVNGYDYRYVDTMENQSAYQITGLTPGLYHVVAYSMDGFFAGGYTQMVPCGLQASCTDHSLIDVEVKPGQDTPNINPADWYAPMDAFPLMP